MKSDRTRILLIEDNVDYADVIRTMLALTSDDEFDVEWVDCLSAALDRLAERHFNVVLLDLSLPDSKGLETFSRLQHHAREAPILLLTGVDDEALALEAVRRGAQDYLVKGQVELTLLPRAIRYAVERHRRAEELWALTRVGRELVETLDLSQVTKQIVSTVLKLFQVRSAILYEFDRASQQLTCTAAAGAVHADGLIGRILPKGTGLAGLAVMQGKTLAFDDPLGDPRATLPEWAEDNIRATDLGSAVALPLVAHGNVVGALVLGAGSGRVFTDEEFRLLSAFADQASIAIRNAQLFTSEQRARAEAEAATRALARSEARFRRIADSNMLGILFWTADGRVTDANDAFLQIVGYTQEDLDADRLRWTEMTPPEYRALDQQGLEEITRGGLCRPYEKEFVRKDGARVPILIGGAALDDSGGSQGVGFVLDLSERRRAEEARAHRDRLRVLSAANLAAREEEAKRIARELHDEAGQLLACVHMALEELALDLQPPDRSAFDKIRALLYQIEEQLRRIAHEVRPTILDDLGLVPALEFLAQGVAARTGLTVRVTGSTSGRLPPVVETTLYRIVQEALTNAARHAKATGVTVHLAHEGELILCAVQDDGVGFDAASVLARNGGHGLGLIGMRDRREPLTGTLRIVSSPGRGTRILITVPLPPESRSVETATQFSLPNF